MMACRRSAWILLFALCLLAAAAADALTVDCEGVVTQFEDYVVRRGLGAGGGPALLASLSDAAAPGVAVSDRMEKLRAFRDRARALEAREELSRFEADQLAFSAEVPMFCFELARTGRCRPLHQEDMRAMLATRPEPLAARGAAQHVSRAGGAAARPRGSHPSR